MTKIIVKTDKQNKYITSYFLNETYFIDHINEVYGKDGYIINPLEYSLKGDKLIETPHYFYYIKD